MSSLFQIKQKNRATGFNENMEDYTAKMFHTHAILGLAAIPFTPYNQYEVIKDNYSTLAVVLGVAWCLLFWTLLILGTIARRLTKRFEKHPKAARWCLDILTTLLGVFLLWTTLQKSKTSDNSQIRYVTGWWNSLVTLSVLNTISRWYLRTFAYATIVSSMAIKTYLDTDKIRPLFILVEIMVYFVLSNFLSYRDSKKKFLEKQKLYEETRIFKEILDQTTDGILIYGLQEGLMYRNWEQKKYQWWKEDQTIDGNLKQIKIDLKKSTGSFITQPMVCILKFLALI